MSPCDSKPVFILLIPTARLVGALIVFLMLAGVTITAAADARSAAVTTTRFYRTNMSDFTDRCEGGRERESFIQVCRWHDRVKERRTYVDANQKLELLLLLLLLPKPLGLRSTQGVVPPTMAMDCPRHVMTLVTQPLRPSTLLARTMAYLVAIT
ncbi:hypothetical protein B566_EDAN001049 [Ephemera danica]|nr:hypothetical protein B566_EDAN001049 [Ephemera danica]